MAPAPGPVFYPRYLDLSKVESLKLLRQLELEAYSGIISALRSQGELTKEKKNLLTEICSALAISPERHRAEIRRAVNDEKLATIALHNSGCVSDVEWIKEGRRIVPIPWRPLPVTKYMEEADRVAEITARENAMLPRPSSTGDKSLLTIHCGNQEPPKKPTELDVKANASMLASVLCIKCLNKEKECVDVDTSTDDLDFNRGAEVLTEVASAPSASDSCVYLPGGTTVRVDVGIQRAEEQLDAYSIKSSSSGNIDFGSAPEISLTGPRASKRKRKKSLNSSAVNKDTNLTIMQVIRPSGKQKQSSSQEKSSMELDHSYKGESNRSHIHKTGGRLSTEFQHRAGSAQKQRLSLSDQSKRRRKKPVSQAVTIQHTPVPPEHLYAVGSCHRTKQRQPLWSAHDGDMPDLTASQKLGMVMSRQSPAKSANDSSGNFSPSSLPPSSLSSSWPGDSTSSMVREFTSSLETMTSQRRGFRPSSSAKKLSAGTESENQNVLKRSAAKKDIKRELLGGYEDVPSPHKIFRPSFHSSALTRDSRYSASEEASSPMLPVLDQRHHEQSGIHPTSLEELASVSAMASALSSNNIVETGLAPVSAIVSRVTSPAPGPLSTIPVTKKLVKAAIGSKLANEEDRGEAVPTFHPRSAVIINAKQHPLHREDTGSIVTISGQHPAAHKEQSAVVSAESGNNSAGVPLSLASLVSPANSTSFGQIPRVISTIAGKPHTVLKSSTGNVITVTAKPLSGMKSTQPAIGTGVGIVKPQLGQKTSIIVVHKAPGSKLGKPTTTNFTAIGHEGSKVITVSTKNLTTPGVNLPRTTMEGGDSLCPSGSALGSIQGLVSGLNSSTAIVKKTKITGSKPKLVTMPVHKKSIAGRLEPSRAKVIQKVIGGPGKVLVKTSASGMTTLSSASQLQSLAGNRIVKPMMSQSSSGSQDIVAAALSQSLGVGAVCQPARAHDGTAGLGTAASGVKTKQEGSASTGIIKVATSTPAASTIKAFAANYQKNSSVSHHKQMLSLSTIQKPVASVTSNQLNQEKAKIFLTSSPCQAKSQAMLFTPNQPLAQRSPQLSSISKTKIGQPHGIKPRVLSSATSQLATIGNLAKPLSKSPQHRLAYHQTAQQPAMQVKVISQPSSMAQNTSLKHPWQATSVIGPAKLTQKGADDSVLQTRVMKDSLDSSNPPQKVPVAQGQRNQAQTRDRATFIYQYHPTTSFTDTSRSIAVSSVEGGDVITLHSVDTESALDDVDKKPEVGRKLVQSAKTNIVKISLSSVGEPSPIGSAISSFPSFMAPSSSCTQSPSMSMQSNIQQPLTHGSCESEKINKTQEVVSGLTKEEEAAVESIMSPNDI